MFKYISPIDVAITVPEDVLDWIANYEYTEKSKSNFQIQRRIISLIRNVDPAEDEFPIEIVHNNDTKFILHFNVYNEIKTNFLNDSKEFGLTTLPKYSRIALPSPVKETILSCLPSALLAYNPVPVLQIIDGYGMLPHTDFGRTSSLFYLLTDPDECTTMWYESNNEISLHDEKMKYGFIFTNASLNRVKLKKSFVIQKNVWHVFDNHTYHAIRSKNHVLRKALQIEFNIPAADLYNILSGGSSVG